MSWSRFDEYQFIKEIKNNISRHTTWEEKRFLLKKMIDPSIKIPFIENENGRYTFLIKNSKYIHFPEITHNKKIKDNACFAICMGILWCCTYNNLSDRFERVLYKYYDSSKKDTFDDPSSLELRLYHDDLVLTDKIYFKALCIAIKSSQLMSLDLLQCNINDLDDFRFENLLGAIKQSNLVSLHINWIWESKVDNFCRFKILTKVMDDIKLSCLHMIFTIKSCDVDEFNANKHTKKYCYTLLSSIKNNDNLREIDIYEPRYRMFFNDNFFNEIKLISLKNQAPALPKNTFSFFSKTKDIKTDITDEDMAVSQFGRSWRK